jgi:hypothetical protein
MSAQINFDASTVDPTNTFDAIPAGEYEVIITDSKLKATKDGAGQYLELKLEIQSGQYQGRALWDRLNLANRNATAVQIAQRQLSQICHAIGVLQVADSALLHNRPMIAKVAVRPEPGRDPSNEVKGYRTAQAVGAAQAFPRPAAPQAPAFQRPAVPAQAASVPPWNRTA